MTSNPTTQHDQAVAILRNGGIVRLRDFVLAGITTATIARMARDGHVARVGRGLYRLPGSTTGANFDLAIVSKAVPSAVICLVSALAFHELTDANPSRIWIAIGPKDRKPRMTYPRLEVVRFSDQLRKAGIKTHVIDGVQVAITTPARTVVDLFRYRKSAGRKFKASPGLNRAIEGLREALRSRKATPAEIAKLANEAGIWKVVQPYLEAMTTNA
jgi:predicted transcriptional regulator of viral defense system